MIPDAALCSRGLNNGLSPFPLHTVHIDLDGAWPKGATESYVDCRNWGRRLRYSATREGIGQFYEFIKQKTARFPLFGSGDFHPLSALWLRKLEEPVTLVSF